MVDEENIHVPQRCYAPVAGPASASRGKPPNQRDAVTGSRRESQSNGVSRFNSKSQSDTLCKWAKVARGIAAVPRDAASEGAASCRPLSNPAHPAYSRVGLAEVSARACLPKRRGGEEHKIPAPATQLCPHGLSRSSAPCAAGVHRLHCRTAARGWGCSPGLVLVPRGGLEIDCGYQSSCRVGGSYIRLPFHVMTMMVVTGEADGRC